MKPIIVVGTGRCGTSAVAGILYHLGINIGERLVPADKNNPKGHFEDLDFKELNLACLDGKISVEEFKKKIKEKGDKKKTPWGMKVPSTSQLLEYYLEVFDAKIIWCKRPIQEITDSMMRSYGWDKWQVSRLITERMAGIEKAFKKYKPTYIEINFDYLLENPEKVVDHLVEFTGVENNNDNKKQATDFIKKDHRKLVIGIGTGRCGTQSLTNLLNTQSDAYIRHEPSPLLPWNKNKGYLQHFNFFDKTQNSLRGEVAYYWINYLDELFENYPDVKVVAVWREKEKVVKSFKEKRASDGNKSYDESFPNLSTEDYWDEYNRLLEEYQKKYPILVLHINELNTEEGQDKIFDFLGVGEHKYIIPIQEIRQKTVWVSVLNQGEIRPEIANILLKMQEDSRYGLHIDYPNAKPEMNNRNQIVEKFLKSGYDYLLMLDSDIVPRKNPLDLIEFDKDIINFVAPQWREGDLYWVALDKVEGGWKPIPPERREGLKEVDATGNACMIIKREVLERMEKPCFEHKFDDKGFHTEGMEYRFCEKAKEQGFKIWVHWDYFASHFKEIDLLEILKLLGKKYG